MEGDIFQVVAFGTKKELEDLYKQDSSIIYAKYKGDQLYPSKETIKIMFIASWFIALLSNLYYLISAKDQEKCLKCFSIFMCISSIKFFSDHYYPEIFPEKGWTPLHFAIWKNNIEAVIFLLEKGIELKKDTVNPHIITPLELIHKLGHTHFEIIINQHIRLKGKEEKEQIEELKGYTEIFKDELERKVRRLKTQEETAEILQEELANKETDLHTAEQELTDREESFKVERNKLLAENVEALKKTCKLEFKLSLCLKEIEKLQREIDTLENTKSDGERYYFTR